MGVKRRWARAVQNGVRQFGTMAAQPTQHAPIRTRPAAPKPVGVVAVAEAHHKSLVCLKGRRQDLRTF